MEAPARALYISLASERFKRSSRPIRHRQSFVVRNLLASTSPGRFKPLAVILCSLWSLPLPCKPQTAGSASRSNAPPVRVCAAAVNAAYLQCRTLTENRLMHPHNVAALGKPNVFLRMRPVQRSCRSQPNYAAPRVSGLALGLRATLDIYTRTISRRFTVSAIERDSCAVERGNPVRTHRPRPCLLTLLPMVPPVLADKQSGPYRQSHEQDRTIDSLGFERSLPDLP